jgi:hypothetical protein
MLKSAGAVKWNKKVKSLLDKDLEDFRNNPRHDITSIAKSREYYENTMTWKCLCDGDTPRSNADRW